MRAAWFERTGPAAEVLVVGTLPDPAPQAGEVLVRVHTSGVNPSDVKHRGGWPARALHVPRMVPHSDGAGEVVAVGHGVKPSRLGERVWLFGTAPPFKTTRAGTAAELVALPASQAIRLPGCVSFAEAAAFGIPASTAHFAVHADGPVAGQTILVQGGAGAVGFYAVQFAVHAGARVIATVDNAARAAHAARTGAHAVIDRTAGDVAARIRAANDGAGVDRIVEVDFGANLPVTAAVLKPHGIVATYSSPSTPHPVIDYYSFQFRAATIRLIQVYILPPPAREAAAAEIARLAEAGLLAHAVDSTYPLAEIARAHARVESGQAIGKVVVEIS